MKKEYWIIVAIILAFLVGIFLFNLNSKKSMESSNDTSKQGEVSLRDFTTNSASSSASRKTYTKVPDLLPVEQITSSKATIKTAKGDITIKFFSDAPLAASNFITLAKDGFFDGLTFHRREEGFVIQGGDPKGNGTGGPGYKFNDESVTRDYTRGIVAMANSGPNTNGSQFFIMLANNPLPKDYTIFGEVISGMDTVDKIEVGDVMEKVTVQEN